MKKTTWEKKIREACVEAGTYKPFFESVISTLAGIMEQRDSAQKLFEQSGGETVVLYKNKAGASNPVKNPALVVVMDLNAQALAYWRDLGLTPAGLKKINEAAMKGKRIDALAEALAELGG